MTKKHKIIFKILFKLLKKNERNKPDFSACLSSLFDHFSDEKGSYAPSLMIYWVLSGKANDAEDALEQFLRESDDELKETIDY